MAYTPLPIVEVDIDDLRLDLDNYRIPTRSPNEAEALDYLFASEDVLGAARLILRNGYFDNEVPIVVRDRKRYVVLEGNRRVSALKALRSPELVPNHENEVRALLRRYGVEAENLPDRIRVLVAANRGAAAPHVARLHTGLSKRRWSRDQQATYYYSLLSAHVTVDDIKARYPGVTITRFIKMAVMRRFLAGVHFSDPSIHDYVISPDLAMSSFEYAYRHSAIAEAMGAFFDEDGHLVPQGMKPDRIGAGISSPQRMAVEYLMNEFRANRLNTRSAAFRKGSAKNAELLAILKSESISGSKPLVPTGTRADASDPEGSRRSTSGGGDSITRVRDGEPNDETTPEDPETTTEPSGTPRGPNHPDTKGKLQLGGLDYTTHTSANLQLRYHELRRLDLNVFPAAAAMLLRSILETTIKFHFEPTSTPATGELKSVFQVVVNAYGSQKPIRQAINTINSGPATTPGSIQWFNLASHSADMVVKAADVRAAFLLLNPVLRILLRPAGSSSP